MTLVGALDPGGYFTLDAIVIPDQPGPLQLVVTVDYTDDFNQPQVITQTLNVEVMEGGPVVGPGEGPGGSGEGGPPPEPETFLQKAWRFILGLIGLDSGQPNPGGGQVPPPGEGATAPGCPAAKRMETAIMRLIERLQREVSIHV